MVKLRLVNTIGFIFLGIVFIALLVEPDLSPNESEELFYWSFAFVFFFISLLDYELYTLKNTSEDT